MATLDGAYDTSRPLAIVSGASSGIGLELARQCAMNGFDLIIAADEPEITAAAEQLRGMGAEVTIVEADLSTLNGVDMLYDAAQSSGRPVRALLANAGITLGHAFLDQNFESAKKVVDTNITGTIYLLHKVGQDMRALREGRILITGSIAGFVPGTYQAVYNGTKAFLNSFSFALRHELKDDGVTVTCLMPGATETEIFERGGMTDTKVGQSSKDDPADVAKTGFDAMMAGEGSVVHGIHNKMQVIAARLMPQGFMAGVHGKVARPGLGNE